MKNRLAPICFAFLLLALARTFAQSPPQSTIPPMPAAPQFDPTSVIQAVGQSGAWTQAAGTSIDNLGKIQYADEVRINGHDGLLAGLQQQINATRAATNEFLLVIPTSSPVGWSGVPVAVTEFQGNARTRRLLDFSSVHYVRLCQNLSLPLAGGLLNLEESTDQITWTPLVSGLDLGTKGVACSPWVQYTNTKPLGDAVVRVTASNPANTAATPNWWYISAEIK